MTYIFPMLQIGISICAAAVYLVSGDVRHAVYWVAAAVLTGAVTLL